MKNAEVLIASNDGVYSIKVNGRATFECAPPLRSLAKDLENVMFKRVDVDLSACTGMDSTFMGILAMLGLRSKKIDAVMTIFNAGELNKSLLFGLGLKKLFNFSEGEVSFGAQTGAADGAADKIVNAQTVLDAHKTLMDVDEENVKKFEKVVDYVQKDLDKLNDKKS
ncbi:MAG: STAS domain-containing protein [Lentisphaeria bacterium]|nr:STAS domain-containing protein [Lentisphaeria bacterium]